MKNRGLLLDRDGVINVDHGYVGTVERFDCMPDIFPFLRKARDWGYRLILVTNQAGVARGKYTQEDFYKVNAHMLKILGQEGITFDLVLSCFEHPEGKVEQLRRMSFWRKPNAGMMLEAALKLNLDLSRSIMIGDKRSDAQAGLTASVGTVLWLGGQEPIKDVVNVQNLKEAEKYL